MHRKIRKRIKRRHKRKPSQKLILVSLTLGWCAMGIGGILMIWGVFQLKYYVRNLIICGLWFFVAGLLLFLIGTVLHRLRHPERFAKSESKLKPKPDSKPRRRRRRSTQDNP